MSSKAVLETITKLEKEFPVSDWRIGGVEVWPVVRVSLAIRMLHRDRHEGAEGSGRRSSSALDQVRQGIRRLRRLAAASSAALADWSHNQRLDREYKAVVLMASSNRRVRMKSGWYAIYSDPFVDLYRSIGVEPLVLERGVNGYRIPRYSPSFFVSPRPPWQGMRSLSGRYRLSGRGHDNLDRYSELRGLLTCEHGVSPPTLARLERMIRQIRRNATVYRTIFERVRPRVGFTVCYYNGDGFAFNLACQEFGIPSVDIQHGVQGAIHFAYGQWTNVHTDGYGLLPTYFWCWTEAEAAAIREWSGGLTRHQPVVGGNLWGNVWREHERDLGLPMGAEVERIRQRGDVHVLYTCDRNPMLPQGLVEAMRLSCDSWIWWVRLHPGMDESDRRQVEAQLQDIDAHRVEVHIATRAPLFQLLGAVDVHATRYSTVVLEAEAAGVGSIVMDRIGEEYYARQIASGTAWAAYRGEEVIAAAEHLLRSGNTPGGQMAGRSSGEAACILRELVETGALEGH